VRYPADDGRSLARPGRGVRGVLRAAGLSVDHSEEVASRATVASAVLGAVVAAVYGAVGLQTAAPLVCGPEHRRPGVRRDGFHEGRERLIEGKAAEKLLLSVVEPARAQIVAIWCGPQPS